MKLRFKGKPHLLEYHGAVDFTDGEEKAVDEATGKYLLRNFGEFFTEVKEAPKPEPRHIEHPPQDRQIKKGRTKKR